MGLILAAMLVSMGHWDSLTDLRNSLHESSTSAPVGRSYERCFRRLSRGELRQCVSHPEISVALQAAWELSHHAVKHRDKNTGWNWVYDRRGSQQFVDYLAKRTSLDVPKWWIQTILSTEMAPGQGSACFGPRYPKSSHVRFVGNVMTVSYSGQRLTAPVATVSDFGDLLAADSVFDGGRCYVVVIPLIGPGRLACFDLKSQQKLWGMPVWATGRTAVNGVVFESVSLVRAAGTIAVFGAAASAYAEGFDPDTGKPVFRFSTSYWQNWSEAWIWPRRS